MRRAEHGHLARGQSRPGWLWYENSRIHGQFKTRINCGYQLVATPSPQPLSPTGARGELTKFFCPCPLPSERVGGFEGAGRQAARFRTDSPAKQSSVLFYGDKNRAGVNDPAIALQRSQVKVSRVIGMAERDFSIQIEVIL